MIRWSALLLLVLAHPPTPVSVRGRVVRVVGSDTLPAAGARVVLHAVTPDSQGPVDSVMADGTGRFDLRSEVDSGAIVLVSARWQGVEYFAPPVAVGEPVTLVVVDTASTQVVTVAARHVIVGGPAADGARDVVDLVVLRNPGPATRVGGGDKLTPTWTLRLPPHVANLTVGDADFSPEAFDVHGDTLTLHAPIPPGERQFFLMYQLAPGARQFEIPLLPRPDTLSLLTEERGLAVTGGMTTVGQETVSGRSFERRVSGSAELAAAVTVALPGGHKAPDWVLPTLIVSLALVLGGATIRILLPRRG
ncbi:MAG TPA: hypothetical protein VFN22_12830 [Gemmatimonadales bacterium]|nr:hypothetical protein [Gemmatimonadales bacterium]